MCPMQERTSLLIAEDKSTEKGEEIPSFNSTIPPEEKKSKNLIYFVFF